MDCAGVLIGPPVRAQNIFFAQADVIQFGALVDFQLRCRELILQIFLIVAVVLRRNAARVRGSIFHQRADGRLTGLVAIVKIVEDALHNEVHDAAGHEEGKKKIKHSGHTYVAPLVVAVSVCLRKFCLIAHVFSGIPRG